MKEKVIFQITKAISLPKRATWEHFKGKTWVEAIAEVKKNRRDLSK